jgi:hypothetical protein
MLQVTTKNTVISDDGFETNIPIKVGEEIQLQELSAAPSALAGFGKVFMGTDHKLYMVNSAGTKFSLGTQGSKEIVATLGGIALQTLASAATGALSGSALGNFIPEKILAVVTAAPGTQNGDAEIIVGTTLHGTEILAAHPLALTTALQNGAILLEGIFPTIAGNDTIYAEVSTADTNVLADMTVTLYLIGKEF